MNFFKVVLTGWRTGMGLRVYKALRRAKVVFRDRYYIYERLMNWKGRTDSATPLNENIAALGDIISTGDPARKCGKLVTAIWIKIDRVSNH
jgi:hypothetical protein